MSEWPGRALSENHSSSNRIQQASQNGIEGKKDEIGWVTEMRDEWMNHADVLKDEIARLTELEDKWMKSIDGVRKMEAELTELRGKLKKSISNLFLTSSQ